MIHFLMEEINVNVQMSNCRLIVITSRHLLGVVTCILKNIIPLTLYQSDKSV